MSKDLSELKAQEAKRKKVFEAMEFLGGCGPTPSSGSAPEALNGKEHGFPIGEAGGKGW